MIRASMKLWRDSIDMKIPVADEFKIHFMQNRQPILEGFVKTGTTWLTMLRDMTPKHCWNSGVRWRNS